MPTYIANSSGNFATVGTWDTVDSTSLLDSEASNTALTTSYVESSAFTPGAITIDGIAIKLASRASGSPSNTITVRLAQAAADVAGTPTTINVSDLPACSTGTTTNEGGWVLFKFAAPVTLLGATAYTVSVKLSATTTVVNLYRNATAGNWSRMLRTTTSPGSLSAGDIFHILGERTGAGTGNDITVTMDNTATTDFGPGSDASPALTIGGRGTLSYATVASTNYYLKLSGDLIVYSGGTLNIGTSGTHIPSTSTAVLEIDPVADFGMGIIIRNGATFNAYGNAISNVAAYLAADAAASATSLTSDISTGWKSGDQIGIAPTTRTASEGEIKALSGDASGTTLPIAALTNAHSGTSPTRAELVNITRNVKIRGVGTTNCPYIMAQATANFTANYIEFYNGTSGTTNKHFLEMQQTTGTCSITYCSMHDNRAGAVYINTGSGSITIDHNVMANCCTQTAASVVTVIQGTSGSHTITNNVSVFSSGAGSSSGALNVGDYGSVYTDNTFAGSGNNGCGFTETANSVILQFERNTFHSNTGSGIIFNNTTGALDATSTSTVKDCKVWRNSSANGGVNISASIYNILFDTLTAFGNSTYNVNINGDIYYGKFLNCVFNGDASFSTTYGVGTTSFGFNANVLFINCSFGQTNAHSTSSIRNNTSSNPNFNFTFIYCLFDSTDVTLSTALPWLAQYHSHKHNQGTTHKNWYSNGTINSDVATRHTASGYSWKLTPNSASLKLRFPGPTPIDTFKIAAPTGVARTITVYVQKDGSYNGNQPRLVIPGGFVQGISTDQIATMTVGATTWEQLSLTVTPTEDGVIECYLDCDGTAGSAYVDDFGVT